MADELQRTKRISSDRKEIVFDRTGRSYLLGPERA
jgi:hypothetical protein